MVPEMERNSFEMAQGTGFDDHYRYHDHEKPGSSRQCRYRYRISFGFKEVEGIHSRTNFDLSQHENIFKSIKYF